MLIVYRVFIIEDQSVIRAAYHRIIEHEPDLYICGEAETGDHALEMLTQAAPDVVLLDLSLPGMSGFELLKQIKTFDPTLQVLIVSGHDELVYAPLTLNAGADGYVDKINVVYALVEAIRQVAGGSPYVSTRVKNYTAQQNVERPNRREDEG